MTTAPVDSSDPRVQEFFAALLRMAQGEYELQAPISTERDHLDAIIHAVNVIVGEMNLVRAQAEAANSAKSRFLANVSHEIRTPIATILGFVELLQDQLPASEATTLARIRANGESLLGLIDQMLDLSAIEAERLTLEPSVVEVVPLFEAIADGFRVPASRKGIDLSLTFEADVPPYMEADAGKVRQIVANLVSNAVKFTREGGIHIQVSRTSANGTPERLRVAVEDTGPGVPDEDRELIFEPFERGVHHGSGLTGSGLGLSIALRLATFMGGSLELAESSRRGATFIYEQPVKWTAAAVAPALPRIGAGPLQLPPSTSILIAEDNQDFRMLLQRILELGGATVDWAADGQEALERAESAAYDLILMDVMMPRMNGTDAARKLRASGFTGPLVALTALASPEQLGDCRDAGFDLVLTKPVAATQLIPKLKHLLDRELTS